MYVLSFWFYFLNFKHADISWGRENCSRFFSSSLCSGQLHFPQEFDLNSSSQTEFLYTHSLLLTLNTIAYNTCVILKWNKQINSEAKGQLISKCLFGIFNSPKKWTKKIRLYYYGTSSRIVFVHFLGELKTPKTFWN